MKAVTLSSHIELCPVSGLSIDRWCNSSASKGFKKHRGVNSFDNFFCQCQTANSWQFDMTSSAKRVDIIDKLLFARNNTPLSKFLKSTLVVVSMSLCLVQSVLSQDYGINLPPAYFNSNGHSNTGTGAFQPGVYNWPYVNSRIASIATNFNMIRFPINEDTANDPASLIKLKGYIDHIPGQWAIICMFDTLKPGQTGHGDGLPNNLASVGAAWAKINATFSSYPHVFYEIFNEPFGYVKNNPSQYVSDMKIIIAGGGLQTNKCILDGMGYADDINLVVQGGWNGMLAYHFYPNWSSIHTQSAYSNLARTALANYGKRTWITEFGANLSWMPYNGYEDPTGSYDTYVDGNEPYSADVNCLRGLDDALRALRASGHGVKGAFVWHGWDNGDTYDYWAPRNSYGARKVMEVEMND